jgi:hypothetical protein
VDTKITISSGFRYTVRVADHADKIQIVIHSTQPEPIDSSPLATVQHRIYTLPLATILTYTPFLLVLQYIHLIGIVLVCSSLLQLYSPPHMNR